MEAIAHENRWFIVYMIYREITVSLIVISNSKLLVYQRVAALYSPP
jgi:hypothetical protein